MIRLLIYKKDTTTMVRYFDTLDVANDAALKILKAHQRHTRIGILVVAPNGRLVEAFNRVATPYFEGYALGDRIESLANAAAVSVGEIYERDGTRYVVRDVVIERATGIEIVVYQDEEFPQGITQYRAAYGEQGFFALFEAEGLTLLTPK